MGRPPKTTLPPQLSELLEAIGKNLRKIREDRGMSQAELSRQSKVSLSTLNEIEKRKFRDIRLSTLTALAAPLKVSAVRFFEKRP